MKPRPGQRYDVAIVGGGISGCVTALRLAQDGASVVLLEQHDLGAQASGRNAGSLHAQIQHGSLLNEGWDWAQAWAPTLTLLIAAMEEWHALPGELGVDLELRTAGGILVAHTEEQLRAVERKVALENQHGVASELLDREALLRVAPYLGERTVGGELCPLEGKANPLLATPAVAAAAVEAGATIERGRAVDAIAREGDDFVLQTAAGAVRAPRLVVAAGADTPRLTRMLGVDLRITGEPMQVSVTEAVAPLVKHLVYFAGGRLTLKQAAAGTLLIGGGWAARTHPVGGHPSIDPEGMRQNLAVARSVVPAIGPARVLRAWVGVNNATPDQRPLIGPIDGVPGLVVGTFPYLGFTAGPLMGRLLAQLVLGRETGFDLQPYAPQRFA